MSVCYLEECSSEVHAKGLCSKHYQRMNDYGRTHRIRRIKGSGSKTADGYMIHSSNGEKVLEHRIVAQEALGKTLPNNCVVHHVDQDRSNNNPINLVICPSQEYHALLHIRQAAHDSCGNANYRKCWLCQSYDDVSSLSISKSGQAYHKKCNAEYAARLKQDA